MVHLSNDGTVLGIDNTTSMYFYNVAAHAAITRNFIDSRHASSYGIAPDGVDFIGQLRAGGVNTIALFRMSDGGITYRFDPGSNVGYSSGVPISADGTHAAAVYGRSVRI